MQTTGTDIHTDDLLVFIQRLRETEIQEARQLQRALVPTEPLKLASVEVTCRLRPAREVGGDFLDYFVLPGRRVGFYLGDVVGKGLPAALYAALTAGTLRGFNKSQEAPECLLTRLNRRLRVHAMPGRFCAVQYGVFELETGDLRFSNAGLPFPLHVAASACQPLGEGGLPSGLMEGASYVQYGARLCSGDTVLFHTDGLMEARNAEGDQFGMNRLAEVCKTHWRRNSQELLDRIFSAVDAFVGDEPQQDDMSALLLALA